MTSLNDKFAFLVLSSARGYIAGIPQNVTTGVLPTRWLAISVDIKKSLLSNDRGPSPAQARPRPDFWGPGDDLNLGIWNQKHPKNKDSQNQNSFCPKCRQGLD